MAEDGGVGKSDAHASVFGEWCGRNGASCHKCMAYPLLNALDVMILTRMLFSCLVDAEFLDTAVIAVCFDCMLLPMRGAWI